MELPFHDLEFLWQSRKRTKALQDGLIESILAKQPSLWGWQVLLLGAAAVTAISGISGWYHIQARKKECEALEKENRCLRDKTETMARKLKNTHRSSTHENAILLEKLATVEDNLARLVEECPPIEFDETEKLEELKALNCCLKEANEELLDLLLCSICFTNNSDCVLGPCGHTLCSTCCTKINKNWARQSENSKGPICPFCRTTVLEVFPKKLKP